MLWTRCYPLTRRALASILPSICCGVTTRCIVSVAAKPGTATSLFTLDHLSCGEGQFCLSMINLLKYRPGLWAGEQHIWPARQHRLTHEVELKFRGSWLPATQFPGGPIRGEWVPQPWLETCALAVTWGFVVIPPIALALDGQWSMVLYSSTMSVFIWHKNLR